MTISFRVEDYLPAGVEKQVCEPVVLPKGQMDNGIPASLVEMTVGDHDPGDLDPAQRVAPSRPSFKPVPFGERRLRGRLRRRPQAAGLRAQARRLRGRVRARAPSRPPSSSARCASPTSRWGSGQAVHDLDERAADRTAATPSTSRATRRSSTRAPASGRASSSRSSRSASTPAARSSTRLPASGAWACSCSSTCGPASSPTAARRERERAAGEGGRRRPGQRPARSRRSGSASKPERL